MNLEGIDLVENISQPLKPIWASKEKWGNELNIPFLEAYKKHPCLWDKPLPTFNDAVAKHIAHLSILNELKETFKGRELTTTTIVRRAIKLKQLIVIEWTKVQKSKGRYKSEYEWYDLADSFLGKIVSRKKLPFHAKPKPSESAVNSATNKKSTTYTYFDVKKEKQFDDFGNAVAENLRTMGSSKGYALYQEMQSLINKRRIDLLFMGQNKETFTKTQILPHITSVKTTSIEVKSRSGKSPNNDEEGGDCDKKINRFATDTSIPNENSGCFE